MAITRLRWNSNGQATFLAISTCRRPGVPTCLSHVFTVYTAVYTQYGHSTYVHSSSMYIVGRATFICIIPFLPPLPQTSVQACSPLHGVQDLALPWFLSSHELGHLLHIVNSAYLRPPKRSVMYLLTTCSKG